ncbi:MAG: 50S ribosomal protein L31 [Candidatus Magasanikbacteria bacterium CG11_big_fil_rev_8_21_14_0_20_39_34]|uniref:50S ribosomal protein L31 n=1 Tax=Candidatus Magasanikbacteria bacterium CG11_big_fil_rev_8_21_14_0_20_39_34 TaxID=1974653 RepID=A0A2H0N690_9BACT|nr:MAG: 50S ribosomal protein L31 [Candidatus Magasanikbacteria bacterium CG11_big_fil_rev_8_21_14_0_20_39_34]
MKTETHPDVHPVVFIDTSCGVEFITTSTMKSDETREINGVTHFVIPLEISSASHPFYTGKQVFIDTARRVEKFQEKMKKVESAQGERKGKKAKRAAKAAVKAKKTEKENAEA